MVQQCLEKYLVIKASPTTLDRTKYSSTGKAKLFSSSGTKSRQKTRVSKHFKQICRARQNTHCLAWPEWHVIALNARLAGWLQKTFKYQVPSSSIKCWCFGVDETVYVIRTANGCVNVKRQLVEKGQLVCWWRAAFQSLDPKNVLCNNLWVYVPNHKAFQQRMTPTTKQKIKDLWATEQSRETLPRSKV